MTQEQQTFKGTIGPWQVEDVAGTLIVGGGYDYVLATVKVQNGRDREKEVAKAQANARLIAQAPALLEALQAAVAGMTSGVRWCNYCGTPDDADARPMLHTNTCWVPAAEAAVAAALGEQS